MPKGKVVRVTVRLPEEVHAEAVEVAREQRRSLNTAIVVAVERYVRPRRRGHRETPGTGARRKRASGWRQPPGAMQTLPEEGETLRGHSTRPAPARPRGGVPRKSTGASADKTEVGLEIQEAQVPSRHGGGRRRLRGRLPGRPPPLEVVGAPRGCPPCGSGQAARDGRGVRLRHLPPGHRGQHQAILLEEAERHGASYRFVNEEIDHTSALGQLMWAVASSFNAIERSASGTAPTTARTSAWPWGSCSPTPGPASAPLRRRRTGRR